MDWDDWAKDDCACGHRNHIGPCRKTKTVTDRSRLPEPAEDTFDRYPFGWPSNWPNAEDLPKVEVPCGCQEARDPEPAEPDWGAREEEVGR